MRSHPGPRGRTAARAVLILAASLAGVAPAARGDGPSTVDRLVDRVKALCESHPGLRGALVKGGVPADGRVALTGTVEGREQAGALAKEARRLVEEEPAWRAEFPGGVGVERMFDFPVKAVLLPRLRKAFADSPDEVPGLPGLLRQTRIDELYFDRDGRLTVVGLCVNHAALIARRNAAANPGADPGVAIARAIRERLKDAPLPAGTDRQLLAKLRTDDIAFEENPSRALQHAAVASPETEEAVFLDARFDASGSLVVSGLAPRAKLGKLAALLAEPAFVRRYQRPGRRAPSDAATGLADVDDYDWRPVLLSGLRERFAGGQELTPAVRHCRIDRATFDWPERGGLVLRFEGVSLLEPGQAPQVATALRQGCRQFFTPRRPLDFNIEDRLELPPASRRTVLTELQDKVASDPALDGVRIDDVSFGPGGETRVEGAWVSADQLRALDAALGPALSARTGGRVKAPVVPKMVTLRTDLLLRELRDRTANTPSLDETSLDRLVLQNRRGAEAPVLTLRVTTLAGHEDRVRENLKAWLEVSDQARAVGQPEVEFLPPRRGSLRSALRDAIFNDPELDGLRLDRVAFNAENVPVLKCVTERPGQLEALVARVKPTAAVAWPGLSLPQPPQGESTAVYPLHDRVTLLEQRLPVHPEAAGVVVTRIRWKDENTYYNCASTSKKVNRAALERLIKKTFLDNAGAVVELTTRDPNPAYTRDVVKAAVSFARAGNLSGITQEPLDLAVFWDPENTAAWYMRGAYHLARREERLAQRDLWCLDALEKESPRKGEERRKALADFQGEFRFAVDNLLAKAVKNPN